MGALSMVSALAMGCGNPAAQPSSGITETNKDTSKPVGVSTAPVTLQFYQQSANISDDEYNRFVVEPVKKKYPHITLELVRAGQGKTIQDLIAGGNIPDIFFTGLGSITNFEKLDLLTDFAELVKKHGLDLNKFEPGALEEIRASASKKQLFALPFSDSFSAMFYNKDIFDKYGVPYPKDNSTWNDIIELGKQIYQKSSRQTFAANPGSLVQFGSALSLPVVDAKSEKAALATDQWKNVLQMYKTLYDLSPDAGFQNNEPANRAFYDQKLAMLGSQSARVGELEELYKKGNPLNWDVTTYPSFQEAPGKRRTMGLHTMSISSQSKYKDQAFQVISLLTESENQLKITQNGRLTALKDQKIKESFGKELKSVSGKNVVSIFKSVPALSPPTTSYDGLANKELNATAKKVLESGVDVNTALRDAEERANKAIAAEKTAEK
jgi:multiple sugar transport system substrate-binding protein